MTMTFDIRLLELIRENEFMYNTTNDNYGNNELKEQEWIKIAFKLDSTVERCKKRWESLRDRIVKDMKYKEATTIRLEGIPTSSSSQDIRIKRNDLTNRFSDFVEEAMNDITTIGMEETPTSSSSHEIKIKKSDLTGNFSVFADEARSPIQNTTPQTNATNDFFDYLAKRVKAAHLNSLQQMRIEASILNFTVEQLYEIQNKI